MAGNVVRLAQKVLSGSVTVAGNITRQVGKTLAASLIFSGLLSKLTSKNLSGSTTPTGSLGIKVTLLKAIDGTLAGLSGFLEGVKLSPPVISNAINSVRGWLGSMMNRR